MKLCVALDLPSYDKNLALCENLKDYDLWLKVGFRSYIRDGKKILENIKEINPNFKIFLDLKLYDIPNTMADAAQEIAKLGIDMFNIHASSGEEAMSAVVKRISLFDNRPIVLAVTALTSFEDKSFKKIYGSSIDEKALLFAKEAYKSKIDGVVCSAFESKTIKENTHKNFLTLSPGIRPFGEDAQDQKRVADIKTAKKEAVDFIVVGRPVYNANDPANVVENILSEL